MQIKLFKACLGNGNGIYSGCFNLRITEMQSRRKSQIGKENEEVFGAWC